MLKSITQHKCFFADTSQTAAHKIFWFLTLKSRPNTKHGKTYQAFLSAHEGEWSPLEVAHKGQIHPPCLSSLAAPLSGCLWMKMKEVKCKSPTDDESHLWKKKKKKSESRK